MSQKKSTLNVNIIPPDNLKTNETLQSEIAPNRKKVMLGKGFSLMDWIRLTKTTPDLAGNNGVLKRVTPEELAKHNKEDDCWLAIFDKVYNVTPYMKYHPGGIDELMKGAGINSTKLFNDVHPWVNLQNMLEKCVVGVLVGAPSLSDSDTLTSTKKEKIADKVEDKNELSKIPGLDFYQSNSTVTVILYTKWKNMKSEFIIIDKIDSDDSKSNLNVEMFVYISSNVYKYTIEMLEPIKNDYDIKVTKEGKVEISFAKIEKIHWSKMNPKLNYQSEPVLYTQTGVHFRACELVKKTRVTRDTDTYTFELHVSTKMSVPLGYHVFLRFPNEKFLTKAYTVIDETFEFKHNTSNSTVNKLHLMVKHYDDGEFTSRLQKIPINSKIEISNYAGSFESERLNNCNELVLICAGSGFTPMIRLINNALLIDSISQIKLLFFNKTAQDILWEENLDQLQKKYANKLNILNVLSQAEPEWKGAIGRINKEILDEFVFKSKLNMPLFCVCGPKLFSDLSIELLSAFNINKDLVHVFSS